MCHPHFALPLPAAWLPTLGEGQGQCRVLGWDMPGCGWPPGPGLTWPASQSLGQLADHSQLLSWPNKQIDSWTGNLTGGVLARQPTSHLVNDPARQPTWPQLSTHPPNQLGVQPAPSLPVSHLATNHPAHQPAIQLSF